MKPIFFWIIILLCIGTEWASAQPKPQTEITNKHLQASGTHFGQAVSDRKWGNINGPSFTSAKFSDYNGDTFVTLKTTTAIEADLTAQVELKSGLLQMVVTDAHGRKIYEHHFDQSQTQKTTIKLEPDQNYQLTFTGSHAAGSYLAQWQEL